MDDEIKEKIKNLHKLFDENPNVLERIQKVEKETIEQGKQITELQTDIEWIRKKLNSLDNKFWYVILGILAILIRVAIG